jgi:ABC-type polysaccharide transport system permease subunit
MYGMKTKLVPKRGERESRVLWDTLVFSVAAIALLLLPLVGYTYNETVYSISGYTFLTGGTVSGGTVAVAVNPWMVIVAACAVIGIVTSLFAAKLPKKVTAAVNMLASLVSIAAIIVFSMRIETALSLAGAKRVGVQYSYLAFIAVGLMALWAAMRYLKKNGFFNGLVEMVTLPVAVVALLAAPFASYTFKKVSHPYTGFDMLTHKIVGSDSAATGFHVIPLLIILCAAAIIVLAVFTDMRKRRFAVSALILSAVIIALVVVGSVTVEGMLEMAKNPEESILSLIPALAAVAIFVRCLYLLYKAKVLSALDFMMVPGLLYLLINNYIPMFGILLAFKKIDYSVGIFNSPWCGFDNFKYLFSSQDAWIITRNTILYNLAFIAIGIFTGMVVGICLFAVTRKVVQTFYQTTILLPQLISMIIVAYIVYAFLSNEAGFINISVLGGTDVNFYGEKGLWPFLLVFINNWKQLGYNSIIFLSSIVGIDRGLYEAAEVDGCSPWQQITHITIPQLKPTIVTLTLLQVGRVFYSDFGLFYQVPLNSGALYNVTNTIDTYVYRSLMVLNNISSASASSAFQAVCGFLLVFIVNMIVRKIDRENALF